MNLSKLIFIGLSVFLVSCSSTPGNKNLAEIQEDKVLARIDGLSGRPSWLKESEPFRIEGG